MESVDCNLCGSQDSALVRVTGDYQYGADGLFHLVKCTRCGLVYLNPRPSTEEMPAHYPPQYQVAMRQILQDVRESLIGKIGLRLMRRTRVPPLPQPGRVLDVGCSAGYYLAALREVGWDVYGLEIDEEAAQYAREHFGLPVRTGAAEDSLVDYPDEHFDVVTMGHVLEHLYDPSQVLREVYRILRPGGVLMLEAPNIDSVPARLLGEYWHPIEAPRHLYHFTADTIQAMLTKAGLRTTKVAGVPAPQESIWSFYVLWARYTNDPRGERLVWHPWIMTLLFPICTLLALFRLSSFMMIVATKPQAEPA